MQPAKIGQICTPIAVNWTAPMGLGASTGGGWAPCRPAASWQAGRRRRTRGDGTASAAFVTRLPVPLVERACRLAPGRDLSHLVCPNRTCRGAPRAGRTCRTPCPARTPRTAPAQIRPPVCTPPCSKVTVCAASTPKPALQVDRPCETPWRSSTRSPFCTAGRAARHCGFYTPPCAPTPWRRRVPRCRRGAQARLTPPSCP